MLRKYRTTVMYLRRLVPNDINTIGPTLMGRYTIGPTLMGCHTKGLTLCRRSAIGRVVNNTNSVTLQSVNTRTENVKQFRENKDI